MLSIYDQIQQLKAEIRHCQMNDGERAEAQATLANLIANQAKLDAAFEADLKAYAPPD